MALLISEARIKTAAAEAHIARLCADIASFDLFKASVSPEAGRAELPWGAAPLKTEPEVLVMRAEARDEDALATLKFVLAERLILVAENETPEIVWTGDGCGAATLPSLRELTVKGWRDITPHMRRITFAGSDLARFDSPSMHVRLLIPPAGLDKPEWPVPGADGRPAWPPEGRRPTSRTYTIRRVDPAAGELDIDFAMHGDEGVASGWAARVEGGEKVAVLGPGGTRIPQADWYLIGGDETAIPAMARIIEGLPETARGHAFIEVQDAAEEQPIANRSGVTVTWLHRGGTAPGRSTLLAEAVKGIAWPAEGQRFGWLGAEAATMKAVRALWRREMKLTREEHLAVAYWRLGKSETEKRAEPAED